MHASAHYQWQGDASESAGLDPTWAGKLGGINDFCIYPDINWIGKLTTVDGKVVDGGCARCHTGLGPSRRPRRRRRSSRTSTACSATRRATSGRWRR